jgi:hypothetical protein
MPMGAAIGAATVGGSLISANAASKAAKAQTAAANTATDIQKNMFEETRGDLAAVQEHRAERRLFAGRLLRPRSRRHRP